MKFTAFIFCSLLLSQASFAAPVIRINLFARDTNYTNRETPYATSETSEGREMIRKVADVTPYFREAFENVTGDVKKSLLLEEMSKTTKADALVFHMNVIPAVRTDGVNYAITNFSVQLVNPKGCELLPTEKRGVGINLGMLTMFVNRMDYRNQIVRKLGETLAEYRALREECSHPSAPAKDPLDIAE